MSSFWQLSTGEKPLGDEASSFAANFAPVPDGTLCDAVISSFDERTYNDELQYSVVWQIVNGEFGGVMVRQTIAPFAYDAKKADRAKNMMKRLYDLCSVVPKHNNPPTTEELAVFIGKKCFIKIGNGIIEDREKTWVREIHAAGKSEPKTGHTEVAKGYPSAVESAFSRNGAADVNLESDIPF
jgi:hypothetical protein